MGLMGADGRDHLDPNLRNGLVGLQNVVPDGLLHEADLSDGGTGLHVQVHLHCDEWAHLREKGIPYDTIPYHTIPYHDMSCHVMS